MLAESLALVAPCAGAGDAVAEGQLPFLPEAYELLDGGKGTGLELKEHKSRPAPEPDRREEAGVSGPQGALGAWSRRSEEQRSLGRERFAESGPRRALGEASQASGLLPCPSPRDAISLGKHRLS